MNRFFGPTGPTASGWIAIVAILGACVILACAGGFFGVPMVAGALAPAQPTVAPAQPTAVPAQPTGFPTAPYMPTAVPTQPTTAPPGARWIGPGNPMNQDNLKVAVEDGGATFVWAASWTIKFSNGKTAACQAAEKKECVGVVLGAGQVAGEDHNSTVIVSGFNAPFGSFNWLQNENGQTSPVEVLALPDFLALVRNSLANNCGGGCDVDSVWFYDLDGKLLHQQDFAK